MEHDTCKTCGCGRTDGQCPSCDSPAATLEPPRLTFATAPRATYTPGPWIVAGHPGAKWGTDWREIHTVGVAYSPALVGIAVTADARLMAESPTMLELLREMVAEYDMHGTVAGNLLRDARQAIARATGTPDTDEE